MLGVDIGLLLAQMTPGTVVSVSEDEVSICVSGAGHWTLDIVSSMLGLDIGGLLAQMTLLKCKPLAGALNTAQAPLSQP